MAWQGILGHDEVVERFRTALERGRLASTYLFVGPAGVGKAAFARKLAQTLLCPVCPAAEMAPCGVCASCVQAVAGTHPDLLTVSRPEDKSDIPVALFIGPKERRMQEGLCHDIGLRPLMGGRRVALIDDADYLNDEGANCLLKTLEEPPPRSVMILIGTSADRQLPTIRSRSQIVRFAPLPAPELAELIEREGLANGDDAARLADFAEGSLRRARELAAPELWTFRSQLNAALSEPAVDSPRLAQQVNDFVNEAGKEAPPRRERLRLVIGFALALYRATVRTLADAPAVGDDEVARCAKRLAAAEQIDIERAGLCIDRCLAALAHVDRNANQSTVIESWLDDLGAASSLGHWPADVPI